MFPMLNYFAIATCHGLPAWHGLPARESCATNSMHCLSAALYFVATESISVDFVVGLELEGVL